MNVSHSQVWVTSVLQNEEVDSALLLCCSLRRMFTTRKIAVVTSLKIPLDMRKILHKAFDYVYIIEEDQNTAGLSMEDFAKLYMVLALQSFDRCTYLAPTMVATNNCDDIFSEALDDFLVLEAAVDTSVFVFRPSVATFKALTARFAAGNYADFSTCLADQNSNHNKKLSRKYNFVIKAGQQCIGNKSEISIVNLANFPLESDTSALDSTGIFGQLVATYVRNLRANDLLFFKNGCVSVYKQREPVLSAGKTGSESIAVVGMSCRYAGCNNVEEFWKLLFEGRDGTSNPPSFRWLREKSSKQSAACRATNAGFLSVPIDKFDARFFGISPKEVLLMDPQHRLLLELVWEALEDSCINPHTLKETAGSVFMGSWRTEYKKLLECSGTGEEHRNYMGNSAGAGAARISFLLGLTGPCIAPESGCAGGAVSVHLACKSLQQGETNLALACGVNLLLDPYDNSNLPLFVSPDGHCKTFSETANGYGRAEGGGVLVLKRLSDAMKDGDHIWGLIRSTALCQDGTSNSLGTPTKQSVSLAMRKALAEANFSPENVSYVEAHGTGTVVGDPLEVAAIANVYGSPSRKNPLIIGSVKTNIGHSESCSGIAGIMKVILAMKNETIPAHINFSKMNPSIDLEAIPALLPLKPMKWERTEGAPRIAGVSSFGITGTNTHTILEEPPTGNETQEIFALNNSMARPLDILTISAKTEEALSILLENYKNHLNTCKESLADIAFSANTGRAMFQFRAAVIGKDKTEICSQIEQNAILKGKADLGKLGKICFLFPGQGTQYPGMAKMLYDTSPIFRMHFEYCEKILREVYNIDITKVMWSEGENLVSEIDRTIYSQTAIFCVEYALFKLWESWGVKPDYVLGHSLGEFAAAVCADIISVEDALKLVAERSRLIEQLPRGKMLVIRASVEEVKLAMKHFANGDSNKILDFAAVNSPQQTVLAGDSDEVQGFSEFCKNNGIKCIVLSATHAFHSKQMDPILREFKKVAETVKKQNGQKYGYISAVQGDQIASACEIDADYWIQQTREKVQFLSASRKAVELGCRTFIEIGPQPVLSALTMINNGTDLLCLASLKKNTKDWTTMLTSLATLHVNGLHVNWNGFDEFYARKKVCLPHYPFVGKSYWPEMTHVTGNYESSAITVEPTTSLDCKSTADFWNLYQALQNEHEKTEMVKERLSLILHHILKHDPEESIDENTEFETMGVDSLMFLEVQNALQVLLGDRIKLHINTLRESNCVKRLAEALVRMIQQKVEKNSF